MHHLWDCPWRGGVGLKSCHLGADSAGKINKEGVVCVDKYNPAGGLSVGGVLFPFILGGMEDLKLRGLFKRGKFPILLGRINTFQFLSQG